MDNWQEYKYGRRAGIERIGAQLNFEAVGVTVVISVGVHWIRAMQVFLEIGQAVVVRVARGAVVANGGVGIEAMRHFPPIGQSVAIAVQRAETGIGGVGDVENQVGPDFSGMRILVVLHRHNAEVQLDAAAAQRGGGSGIDQAAIGRVETSEGLDDGLLVDGAVAQESAGLDGRNVVSEGDIGRFGRVQAEAQAGDGAGEVQAGGDHRQKRVV